MTAGLNGFKPSKSSNLQSVFSAMTGDELESARLRHQSLLDQQQYIVRQIEAEKRRRTMASKERQWTCSECKEQTRGYLVLPCRHLGLCVQCDANKCVNKSSDDDEACHECGGCVQ